LIMPTPDNVIGVLSLIIWTLIILVGVEYAWLAMSLGRKGEGGTIVLKEILVPLLTSNRQVTLVTFLSFIGISLLMGDGVLTPAMSILSAVEGILLIPDCSGVSHYVLIGLASLIALLLFILQKKGVERVAAAFGPVMIIWFSALAITGFIGIFKAPFVLKAINPWFALNFIYRNGFAGFFVLSEVILCATGGEALYADMGHLGRRPIIQGWFIVFWVLVLTYLGQGAFLIAYPAAKYVLYEMILSQASALYIPFLVLSLLASIIGSQAMISGIFSIVYQGIMTNMLPMFHVEYTSSKLRSQIYVGFVNWFLLVSVLIIIFHFQESHSLAAAYGFAVTGSMTLTAIMMTWIFYLRRCYGRMAISIGVMMVVLTFFVSGTYKIPHGAYWSILISLIPFSTILIYTYGQRRLVKAIKPMHLSDFLEAYVPTYQAINKIKGSALFFVRSIDSVQPYLSQTMFKNNIVYEDNIMISIITRDDPFGVIGFFKGNLADGLRIFEIHMGYMEVLDIDKVLHNAGIEPKVIFYG
ncbi:MAG: KUP/HAK/KT family potassium transporter, partial [Bacteroidetes bacterium]|nr:KUP/HAK/KT family potassium transporter [Bacteroidota bacterium]